MYNQESFGATWGPMYNLSNGSIVVDERAFSLVPNGLATAATLSFGKDAYSTKTFPIEDIAGYKNGLLAWMTILLRNGDKLKISIGSKSKKLELIKALEQRRLAIFRDRGQNAPRLVSII
ncbi:MAG: hypothetical protein K2M31_07305 [Muribaculaceae bacterium]|nr:hypothetical protein [Muribaculaceae bacterium]